MVETTHTKFYMLLSPWVVNLEPGQMARNNRTKVIPMSTIHARGNLLPPMLLHEQLEVRQ